MKWRIVVVVTIYSVRICRIHTDAIKENLIPSELTREEINYIYADEADMLNKALFGITAKERKNKNLNISWNIRDYASIKQLIILANIESMNAKFIEMWLKQNERLKLLNGTAITQMKSLLGLQDKSILGFNSPLTPLYFKEGDL